LVLVNCLERLPARRCLVKHGLALGLSISHTHQNSFCLENVRFGLLQRLRRRRCELLHRLRGLHNVLSTGQSAELGGLRGTGLGWAGARAQRLGHVRWYGGASQQRRDCVDCHAGSLYLAGGGAHFAIDRLGLVLVVLVVPLLAILCGCHGLGSEARILLHRSRALHI
jgi:hypothetical protein